MSQLRKKFDEAMRSLPKDKAKNSSAAQGLAYCSLVFGLEDDFSDLMPEERYKQRRKQAKPVLDAFFGMGKCEKCCTKAPFRKGTDLLERAMAVHDELPQGRQAGAEQ